LLGVLFPALSTSLVTDRAHASDLFQRAVSFIFLVMFPATLLIVVFGHEGLNLWLGRDFASRGTAVLQWIALGVFINSFAQIPFGAIQADGRPDLTAKLHIAEAPIYIAALFLLIKLWGIEGAAIAWCLRTTLDAVALFWISLKLLPECRAGILKRCMWIGAAFAAVLSIVLFPPQSLQIRIIAFGAIILSFSLVYWYLFLDRKHRNWFLSYLRLKAET
jgi:O-antigen/teichoic acid export membrane protein